MEIKIVVKKSYLFLILGFILVVGLVVAYGGNQPSVMGHSFFELEGVAPNCAQNPTHAHCAQLPGVVGWSDTDPLVAIAAAKSADSFSSDDSDKLGGLNPWQYCQGNGSNCNFEGKGAIIGGGNSGTWSSTISSCVSVCSAWGVGTTCSGPFGGHSGGCGGIIQCPSGSTRREVSRSAYSFYICVKN